MSRQLQSLLSLLCATSSWKQHRAMIPFFFFAENLWIKGEYRVTLLWTPYHRALFCKWINPILFESRETRVWNVVEWGLSKIGQWNTIQRAISGKISQLDCFECLRLKYCIEVFRRIVVKRFQCNLNWFLFSFEMDRYNRATKFSAKIWDE